MSEYAKPLPGYLVDRYRKWRTVRFEEDRVWYERLATEGQRPRAMVISCCDSRTDVVNMFGAEPGDLFVVRNVANIVPPFAPDHSHHGTSAAVEYACTVLKVANIVVIGHSGCGGVAGCHDMCAGHAPKLEEEGSFIGRWVEILRPAYERVAEQTDDRGARLKLLEREGVLQSLGNLETFPFVRDALEKGSVALHGAFIDIASGQIEVYDPASRMFKSA